ncbi:hypothetical protein PC128_g17722 [Phytophthora cactorum]|uniref:Chromo domain-containing protein n=1 Tax=Phytophthora cactorum TaxID=29920 RepID=A0A8T1C0Q3_9STRA|nr:hypothetical protein PC117_g18756 [Phytophthora cactorum]KAG3030092.1 hypothetical protein PC120_g3987 [Phytophthora cactorum]KAG3175466.1 hypothetical protein PC128_g17722 [Phytophthora cactorum]
MWSKERQYRVRLLGYPPAEDSWDPRSPLVEDVPDVMDEYEKPLTSRSVSE